MWRSSLQAAHVGTCIRAPSITAPSPEPAKEIPEAITNLEHLFMQLISLKESKKNNQNNKKKKRNTTAGCAWYNPHQSLLHHPSLRPTAPSSSAVEPPHGTSPIVGCCQLSGSLLLRIDKNGFNLLGFGVFFSCILMFCSFFMVLFLLFKKAPLQSVIPITIIHLKNSIYRFIYIFLYIYFYVQDVLASLSDEQLSKSRRTWWFVQHLDFKGCLLEEMP